MTNEERWCEYTKQAKEKLRNIERFYLPPDNLSSWDMSAFLSWMKASYVEKQKDIEDLRYKLHVFRDHVLSWPETQGRVLTVEDAQQLNVCRICKKDATPLPDNPLILDYGKEFAHQKCIQEKDSNEDFLTKLNNTLKEFREVLGVSVSD